MQYTKDGPSLGYKWNSTSVRDMGNGKSVRGWSGLVKVRVQVEVPSPIPCRVQEIRTCHLQGHP